MLDYSALRLAVIGDYCLDRYLEIDPARQEISIETGLPVHNVVRVRAQAGAAGTVLNNLVALGVGTLHAVGFCGDDGEGYELRRALSDLPGVRTDRFLLSAERRTFTYCKPLILEPGAEPRELSRLDSKNWTATPVDLESRLIAFIPDLIAQVDAVIVMEQVDHPGTGAITPRVRAALREALATRPEVPALADSRIGLRDYAGFTLKMNLAELSVLLGQSARLSPEEAPTAAAQLAQRHGHRVFVTMAENGILCADPDGSLTRADSLPLRGPIDVVGAGDSVTANLTAALAAGAAPEQAMRIAMAAASIVVHQLGTTGTASPAEIATLLAH